MKQATFSASLALAAAIISGPALAQEQPNIIPPALETMTNHFDNVCVVDPEFVAKLEEGGVDYLLGPLTGKSIEDISLVKEL